MDLEEIVTGKTLKSKDQVTAIAQALSDRAIKVAALLDFAAAAKDPVKANCIEALEFASKIEPNIISDKAFDFCIENLSSKTPRIKWESAKVIGNSASQHPKQLEKAVAALLTNTEDKSTVVRWAAAYALAEIIKLRTKLNNDLLPAIESVIKREEKNSIRKIYLKAIK